jgi:hypothetical protein
MAKGQGSSSRADGYRRRYVVLTNGLVVPHRLGRMVIVLRREVGVLEKMR